MTAQELVKLYGDPSAVYQAHYCTLWHIQEQFPWFPADKIFINIVFMQKLIISFKAVESISLQSEIVSFNGCYVNRPVRGSNFISAHAYAAAIDLNADKDRMFIADNLPLDDPKRLGTWSKSFVDAMTSGGVFFGGYFQHRADPMHFSMADM
jgi:hypothetical protein